MTKSERSKQIFKKGDIVSPFSNVQKSNEYRISKIIRAKVTKIYNIGYTAASYKQQLCLEILEGYAIGVKSKHITIYSNSVELNLNIENYEIF